MTTAPKITQQQLPRTHMLMLALLLRPGTDFIVLGTANDPQILMDLSQDELTDCMKILNIAKPVFAALTEGELTKMLALRLRIILNNASE